MIAATSQDNTEQLAGCARMGRAQPANCSVLSGGRCASAIIAFADDTQLLFCLLYKLSQSTEHRAFSPGLFIWALARTDRRDLRLAVAQRVRARVYGVVAEDLSCLAIG